MALQVFVLKLFSGSNLNVCLYINRLVNIFLKLWTINQFWNCQVIYILIHYFCLFYPAVESRDLVLLKTILAAVSLLFGSYELRLFRLSELLDISIIYPSFSLVFFILLFELTWGVWIISSTSSSASSQSLSSSDQGSFSS